MYRCAEIKYRGYAVTLCRPASTLLYWLMIFFVDFFLLIVLWFHFFSVCAFSMFYFHASIIHAQPLFSLWHRPGATSSINSCLACHRVHACLSRVHLYVCVCVVFASLTIITLHFRLVSFCHYAIYILLFQDHAHSNRLSSYSVNEAINAIGIMWTFDEMTPLAVPLHPRVLFSRLPLACRASAPCVLCLIVFTFSSFRIGS